MGNAASSGAGHNKQKSLRVALKVHQTQYVAGEVITGSVYLSVDKESSLQDVHGLYLLFEGFEHVEVESSSGSDTCEQQQQQQQQQELQHNLLEHNSHRQHHYQTREQRREERRRQRDERQWERRQARRGGGGGDCCCPHDNFHGEEHLQPPPCATRTNQRRTPAASTPTTVDRETAIVVRSEYPIALVSQLRVGQFEYPFQWRLPLDLPSSMYCSSRSSVGSSNNSFAEIRYSLTAYLARGGSTLNGQSSKNFNNSATRAEVSITIVSQPQNLIPCRPLLMESERFPIFTCGCWNQGSIHMGWKVDKDVVSPEDHVTVEIFGENHSHVRVHQIMVQWQEIVQWSANSSSNNTSSSPRKQSEVVSHTLAEQVLDNVENVRCWQPWYKPSHPGEGRPATNDATTGSSSMTGGGGGGGRSNYQALNQDPFLSAASSNSLLVARLVLPAEARDTYVGRLLRVSHELSVQVCTSGCGSTWPCSSSSQVRIVRAGSTAVTQQQQPATQGSLAAPLLPDDMPVVVPEAQLLPSAEATTASWEQSWVVGEAVVIQEADVMLLDSELRSMTNNNSITPPMNPELLRNTEAEEAPSRNMTTLSAVLLQPSAPDEYLVESSSSQVCTSTTSMSQSQGASPSHLLDQLLTIVRDSPEILEVVLQDDTWASFVQNLSPRDFCSVLQQAGHSNNSDRVAAIARTLARTMCPKFECRHLLACIWTIPETSQRIEILKQALPFVSDINVTSNQTLLERELSPAELVHFRMALQAASRAE